MSTESDFDFLNCSTPDPTTSFVSDLAFLV
uniref:Uncharacterized protein n=1 Tax=Rhizophora mucronata TaxID=61149 RepID=A0A2P2QWE8_RHIMU